MQSYKFMVRRSSDGEELFFAKMGRFFASTKIRNEMGGSALSDLPSSVWLTFSDKSDRVIAFLLVEMVDKHLRIKDGYVEPEHREKRLFSKLIDHAVSIAESNQQSIFARVRKQQKKHFTRHKFRQIAESGNWITMEKKYVARRDEA